MDVKQKIQLFDVGSKDGKPLTQRIKTFEEHSRPSTPEIGSIKSSSHGTRVPISKATSFKSSIDLLKSSSSSSPQSKPQQQPLPHHKSANDVLSSSTRERRGTLPGDSYTVPFAAALPLHKSISSFPFTLPQKPAVSEHLLNTLPPALLATIKSWLPGVQFHLLYQATRDGFEESVFHQKCDKQGPTLCIMQSHDGFVFGGYAPDPWDSPDKVAFHANPSAFLFTLTNPHSLPPRKYALYHTDPRSRSTKCSKRHGISFGEQEFCTADLQISCSAHIGYSNVNFPVSFEDTTGKGDKTFTSTPRSVVRDVVVYSVK